MAVENCEIECFPEAHGVSTVEIDIGVSDDQRWSDIMLFCEGKETPGEFSFDMIDQGDRHDIMKFFFSDANVAFEFKMRFV